MNAIPQNQDLNELLAAPPVGKICIGGEEYRLGQLSDAFFEDWTHFGCDVMAGKPVTVDIHRHTRALLMAGNPGLCWEDVRPHVTREHCFTALYETIRQSAHWGVRRERSAGSA